METAMDEVPLEGKVAEPRLLYNSNTAKWISENVIDPAKSLHKKMLGKGEGKRSNAQKVAIIELRKKVLEKIEFDELSKTDQLIMKKGCDKLFELVLNGASHAVIEKKKWKLALGLREECDSTDLT